MIRLAFMTDDARVIGASTPEADAARVAQLPPALHAVMAELYDAPSVVVGRPSAGPWAGALGQGRTVYVLTRTGVGDVGESLRPIGGVGPLVDRFGDSDKELLVAGGRRVFQLFLPHADRLDIALTDERVPGDLVFDAWDDGAFDIERTDVWEGGRTLRLVRRPPALGRGAAGLGR